MHYCNMSNPNDLTNVDPSNVEDCHCLKSTRNASQKLIVKRSKRKAKPNLKNAEFTGTGLPPDTPIFVNQSLRWCDKCLCSRCKKL